MLQHDYLLEVINEFVETASRALRSAYSSHEPSEALEEVREAEQDVSALLDLDPSVAMSLEPDSLVTMMVLSGLGDAVSAYVAFVLSRLAQLYEKMGDSNTANLRREQVNAIVTSFGCDPSRPPEEFSGLARELDAHGPAFEPVSTEVD
jgi:hypothetical protein